MMATPFSYDPAQTAAFKRIEEKEPLVGSVEPLKAVVIGGGTGAPVSIKTLLSLGVETSAVVAMADDGGSTGKLREEAGVTPPGDIRKCLVAFAAHQDDPLTHAFKYRFEFAQNHTLGNLMLSALEQATHSFPQAIEICEGLLHARGHVYPSTLDNIHLIGQTCDGSHITGQAALSHAPCALSQVWLDDAAHARPYPGAIKAICEADLLVFGPGSLFTSIIPNVLVPGILDAIRACKGKKLFICSLADMQGETWGLSAEEHVGALLSHGLQGLIDYVLVHTPEPLRPARPTDTVGEHAHLMHEVDHVSTSGVSKTTARIRPVPVSYEAACRIQAMGPMVLARNLVDPLRPTWHDPLLLRNALKDILKLCPRDTH